MRSDTAQTVASAKKPFGKAAAERSPKPKPNSPLTLRLTPDERTRLEELAAGMTLSAYVRACVFGADTVKRKKRPKTVVEDKRAAAEALALLGQSRIASNLNQLAYHANIGLLEMGEQERADIAEANAHLSAIRTLLVSAPGKTAPLGRSRTRRQGE